MISPSKPTSDKHDAFESLDTSLANKGLIYIGEALGHPEIPGSEKDYLNYCTKLILDAGFSGSSDEMYIMINNCGGDVFDFIGIYEAIMFVRTYGNRIINTIANGLAASAATIILQAGNRRIMTPNSYLMIHNISTESNGTLEQIKQEVVNASKVQDTMDNIICQRSGLSNKKLKQIMGNKDLYLTANEALNLNLIDEITQFPHRTRKQVVKSNKKTRYKK